MQYYELKNDCMRHYEFARGATTDMIIHGCNLFPMAIFFLSTFLMELSEIKSTARAKYGYYCGKNIPRFFLGNCISQKIFSGHIEIEF